MFNYFVQISLTAKQDIKDIHNYIAYELLEPLTAERYVEGIYAAIRKLAIYGGSVAINQRAFIQRKYGPGARTVAYKRKITIIYNVIDDIILVRRVISGSLVI